MPTDIGQARNDDLESRLRRGVRPQPTASDVARAHGLVAERAANPKNVRASVRSLLALAAALLLVVFVVATRVNNAASEPPAAFGPALSAEAPSTDSSQRVHGAAIDRLDWEETGIELDDALIRVGQHVALPPASAAGEIEKVVLDETSTDPSGHPGIMILFESGIKLFAAYPPHDMADLGADAAPFTDGRTAELELKERAGVEILVCEAGWQGESRVLPRIMWNDANLGYTLIAPSDEMGTEELVGVMESMD